MAPNKGDAADTKPCPQICFRKFAARLWRSLDAAGVSFISFSRWRGQVSDVLIRCQEPGDAKDLHDVYSQPRVVWGTLQMPYPSLHSWQTRAGEEPRGMIRLVACMDDRVVGNIAIWTATSPRRRHVGEVAMAVHDEWQGKGCGTALLRSALDLADNWMGLNRIELQVFTDNEPGRRLYEGNGFEIEGTLRRFALRAGEYADVYAMGRVR